MPDGSLGSNPLLDLVCQGLGHAALEAEEMGRIEGFESGANAMRNYIMQGDPTVPKGEYRNPHEMAQEMRELHAKRWKRNSNEDEDFNGNNLLFTAYRRSC